MLFSSLIFLQIFLPLTLAVYYGMGLLPGRSAAQIRHAKNNVLLIASLVFYGFSGLKYLLLMMAVILVNYAGGFLVAKGAFTDRERRRNLIAVVIVNLGILFYFKYFNMFRDIWQSLERLFGHEPEAFVRVILPVGISFYIFQALSYVIDVYRGDTPRQRNLWTFALYISCFPQLIAGPIVQYSDVARQLTSRKENEAQFAEGVRRFLYGLGKKVVIANTMAEVTDQIWALDLSRIGAGLAWIGGLTYLFQLYYDFSGYSDMAIGLGKMFGLDFMENFRYPYISGSITEYWRRNHISLGAWFRKYVYFPLGGSRVSKRRMILNLIVVFFLTGVWHGANWTFFFWGLYHVVWLILEKLFLHDWLEKNTARGRGFLNRIYAFLVLFVSLIFFRANSLGDAFRFITQLFGQRTVDETVLSFLSWRRVLVFLAAAVGLGYVQEFRGETLKKINGATKGILEKVYLLAVLILCLILLTNDNYNPFIYFQF